MRVRTFHFGMAEGLPRALELLDAEVEKLGGVTIHSVQDTLYKDVPTTLSGVASEQLMVRVVIYTPKQ